MALLFNKVSEIDDVFFTIHDVGSRFGFQKVADEGVAQYLCILEIR